MSSVDEGSSGEECSLRIVTERRSEGGRGKRTLGRGKGRGRGRGGAEGSAEAQDDSCPKPGDVVWAKVMGFNFWPAKIFDAANDDVVPSWLKDPPKASYILVRFFGTYDMQWVSPNSIESYNRGLKKKFHSKSKSKVFQKAVKEVFTYMEDSVMPEGLTIRPPDPPVDSEEEESSANKDLQSISGVVSNSEDLQTANNGSAFHLRGSSRRKSATPRRLSSSSSDSLPKRPCLDGEGRETDRLRTPEVEAFTCAPLPLAIPSAGQEGSKKQENSSAENAQDSEI